MWIILLLQLPTLCISLHEEAEKQAELQSAILVNQITLSQHTEILKKILNTSHMEHHSCCLSQGKSPSVEILQTLKESLDTFLDVTKNLKKRGECPYPYIEVVNECFFAHPKKLTWPQARKVCRGMGGDLAEPENAYALQTYLATHHGPSYFWVGGSDLDYEGTWKWISGRSIDTTDWLFARPDNLSGDEHCLEIVMSDYPNLFNDETCSVLQRFICQYKH